MLDTAAKTSSQNGVKAAGVEPSVSASADQVPDPEVVPKAIRRPFDKLRERLRARLRNSIHGSMTVVACVELVETSAYTALVTGSTILFTSSPSVAGR